MFEKYSQKWHYYRFVDVDFNSVGLIDELFGDFVDVGNELLNSSVAFTLGEVIAVETVVIYINLYCLLFSYNPNIIY